MWKDIKDYEGLYQVSDDGRVRRILNDGRTREIKNRDGVYLTVSLSKRSIKKTFNVHRLVAEHFLPRPPKATEVNHKDGNKHNNNLSNLEWVTQRENLHHAMDVLGINPFGKPPRRVNCYDINGNFIKEYPSVSAAARSTGKRNARVGITLACQGEYRTAHGYKWEYAD